MWSKAAQLFKQNFIIFSLDSFIIHESDIQSEGSGRGERHVDKVVNYSGVVKGRKFPEVRRGGDPRSSAALHIEELKCGKQYSDGDDESGWARHCRGHTLKLPKGDYGGK